MKKYHETSLASFCFRAFCIALAATCVARSPRAAFAEVLGGGNRHTVLLLPDGTVEAFGGNNWGQLNVPSGTDFVSIDSGYEHVLALRSDGTIVAWGRNDSGQINIPGSLGTIIDIGGGRDHSIALKADGTVAGWGNNGAGQATPPVGLNGVVAIAVGHHQNLALKSDGTAVGWGSNADGETTIPTGLSDVMAIAAGGAQSLALLSDGTVVAWGRDNFGQATVPTGLTDVVSIAGGEEHSLALKSDGTVVAWGQNADGQTDVPLGLTNVAAIAGKGYHSVALKSDGTIAAWGRNGDSQLDAPVGLNLSTDAVWKNPDGGQFLAMYNWEGDTPSTSGSRAVFTLPETYSVEFTTDSRAKAILVDGGFVRFELSGQTFSAAETTTVSSNAGLAALSITDGTLDTAGEGIIGDAPGGQGHVAVGATGTWNVGSDLWVGREGSGSLDVLGVIYAEQSTIGEIAGSDGVASVDGIGAQWNSNNWFGVGNDGTGSLEIMHGGVVNSFGGEAYLGSNDTGTGTATVTGAGSQWNNSGVFYVGDAGQGTLTIEEGAVVNSDTFSIGQQPGSNGHVIVKDFESSLNVLDEVQNRWLAVGEQGNGVLEILDGAYVNSGETAIGFQPGSFGQVTVDAATLLATKLTIGGEGFGELTISNGGFVEGGIFICEHPGSVGDVNVTGNGTRLVGGIYVAEYGTGSLTVSDGAEVTSETAYVGWTMEAQGNATIDGIGTSWTNDSLSIGGEGTGTVAVTNGGYVTSGTTQLGLFGGGNGQGTVSGVGSVWENKEIYVGVESQGSLSITEGGRMESDFAILGEMPGSHGEVILDGPGSRWDLLGNILIGYEGGASMAITNGAVLDTGFDAAVGQYPGSVGTVVVSGPDSFWSINGALALGPQGGEGIVTVEDGATILVKYSLIVGADVNSTARLNLNGGTLDLNGSQIASYGGDAQLNFTAGRLQNVSTISFDLDQNGGTLAAGASPGTMEFDANYNLNIGTLEVELAGSGGVAGSDFDFYNVTGDATLAGSIDILSYLGFVPTDGDTFDVLTANSIIDNGISLTGLAGFSYSIIPGGNGDILQLQYAEPVPEPSGSLLLIIGFPWLIRHARRRGCRSLRRRWR